MKRWTIGARIRAGYGVLLALLLVVASMSAYALLTTRDEYDSALSVQRDEAGRGMLASKAFSDANRNFRAYLLTNDETYLRNQIRDLQTARTGMRVLRDRARGTERGARWSDVLAAIDSWEAGAQRTVEARRAGRAEEAMRRFRTETLVPAQREDRLVRDLVADADRRAEATRRDASDRAVRSLWLAFVVAGVALIAGVVIAVTLARSVTARLRHAIGTLASASSEILAATRQQAAGVLEEETAVQETSATVDEVKQTVRLSTEKAGSVADAVLRTSDVSEDGRRAVDETINGTREAKVRMQTIADRILALSEQAETIAEITATVNDLADQSSLLAVNAGIEAAKAGESGRGFAVVAVEVKALAEQSKQAAGEIRRNLGDIRQATQAAVLATEQGVDASESGENLARQAGEAIHSLVEKLDESAQAAQQILASSQQQMTGMDQVAVAMDNIRATTSQNMAATRQVEQAAQDLHELAQGLKALVASDDSNGAIAVR